MASNDTNFWDNDPDELLRRHWQQTFADFEVPARPSLGKRILGQLTPKRRPGPTRWLAVASLLLLLSAGIYSLVHFQERSTLPRANTTATRQLATSDQPLLTDHIRSATEPVKRSSPPETRRSAPAANEPVAERPSENRLSTTTGINPVAVKPTIENHTTTKPLSSIHPKFHPWVATKKRTSTSSTKIAWDKSAHVARTSFSGPPLDRSVPTGYESPSASARQSVSIDRNRLFSTQGPAMQPSANALAVAWAPLKPHGMLTLSSPSRALPNQLPTTDLEPSRSIAVAHKPLNWFVEAIPLSSFQWMRAAPISSVYLSEVDAPAAFSPATWGYQVNGGVRFERWQAYVSVGKLRRWAYYTVNENRYRVEPSSTDPNQLVRETHTVAENVLLPLIGVGLSRRQLVRQGRYVAEFGGQAAYLPTIGQTLIGLRGGAGRRITLGRLGELQIGLTAEYGINRLLSAQRQLAIHPLTVGIGFRFQPRSGE